MMNAVVDRRKYEIPPLFSFSTWYDEAFLILLQTGHRPPVSLGSRLINIFWSRFFHFLCLLRWMDGVVVIKLDLLLVA